MKLLFVTLCVLFVAVHGDRKMDPKSEKILQECLEENDIKEGDIKSLENNKDDPKLRCIMACIFEKEGALTNGEINSDVIKKDIKNDFAEIDTQKISEFVDKCVDIANVLSDICEKTSAVGGCLKEELENLEKNKHQ